MHQSIEVCISGHHYTIEYLVNSDGDPVVTRTACRGRWEMTSASSGSTWLDNRLLTAVKESVDFVDNSLERERERQVDQDYYWSA
jgi:hypothetical protein